MTTTAYHPQSNSMIERFHRQLKESLCARCEGKDWLEHLPWVLLGLRAAPKDEANISSAEAALGTQLSLLCEPPLRAILPQEPAPIPSTVRSYADVVAGRSDLLATAEFAYVRSAQPSSTLAPSYVGPYKILQQRGKAVLLQMGDKQDWVALEGLKLHVGTTPLDPAKPPLRGRPRKTDTEDSF